MTMLKKIQISAAILASLFCLTSVKAAPITPKTPAMLPLTVAPTRMYPEDQKLYDLYPNAVLYYYGYTVDNPLIHALTLRNLDRWPENIQSLEYMHTLGEENIVRRFFSPVVGVVQLAANVTLRNGREQSRIVEVDPYIAFRWANLPWNHYLNTSFAIGEGVSYASSVPAIEKRQNDDTKRLLNYLMFEATFAHPEHPRLQYVLRVHHRSGAYGLYHAGNTGSNDVGIGIRYLFD